MYSRIITNIVVGNTATSVVRCYRGQLGTIPVAQNGLGNNNTLKGRIVIPAGQQFYVQWSAVGTAVSDAFARVSWERDDNPLVASGAEGHEWSDNLVTSITLPSSAAANDPAIIIGQDLPACMQADYTAAIFFRPPFSVSSQAPYWFIAQAKTPGGGLGWQQVDYGYLLYDGVQCGYVVYKRERGQLALPGSPAQLAMATDMGVIAQSGDLIDTGPLFFNLNTTTLVDLGGSTTTTNRQGTSYTTTSTSYTATGAVFCGLSFVWPRSEKMVFTYNARMRNNTAGLSCFISFILASGSTVGSGSTLYGPNDSEAVDHAGPANNSDSQARSFMLDNTFGLTIGSSYNLYLVHRVEGGTGTFSNRQITISPEF
jgi:hypothetical protein